MLSILSMITNDGKLDSMLTADNLLRQRLSMVYDSVYRCELVRKAVKDNDLNKIFYHLDVDEYVIKDDDDLLYTACDHNNLEMVQVLLRLNVFTNDQASSVKDKIKLTKRRRDEPLNMNELNIIHVLKNYRHITIEYSEVF